MKSRSRSSEDLPYPAEKGNNGDSKDGAVDLQFILPFDTEESLGQITMNCSFSSCRSDTKEPTTDDNIDIMEEVPIDSFQYGESLPSSEDIRFMILSQNAGGDSKISSCRVWGFVMAVAIGLLIGAEVLLLGQDNRSISSGIPVKQRASRPEIKRFLLSNGISSKDSLATGGTPQHLAINWMSRDDPAGQPIPTDTDIQHNPEAYLFMTRYIMVVNYFAMGGSKNWSESLNFLSDVPVCGWWNTVQSGNNAYPTGLICTKEGTPKELVLDFNKMVGEIPSENGMLTTLDYFDLKGNSLKGSIPSELCQLTNLKTLSLGHNGLTGTIPACLGEVTQLEVLFLSDNSLDGELPGNLKHLTKLRQVFIDDNFFTGNIHHVFKFLTNLEFLFGDNNAFSGPINDALAKEHEKVQRVNLSNNNLTMSHTFPLQILQLPQLEILDLSHNKMAGKLPDTVIESSRLKFLALHDNQLSGTMPLQTISSLKNLKHLDLSDNKFTGGLPTEWASSIKLTSLFLGNNPELEAGPLPNALNVMRSLEKLCLKNTNRQGALPEQISALNKLVLLDLDQNQLTGTVPAGWSQLRQLQYLLLNRNPGVRGPLTLSQSSYASIQLAYLDGTSLTGSVEFMCKPDAKIVANCGAGYVEKCSCCHCCETTEACSDPMVTSMNASWESQFRRPVYFFDGRVAL